MLVLVLELQPSSLDLDLGLDDLTAMGVALPPRGSQSRLVVGDGRIRVGDNELGDNLGGC